MIDRKLLNRVAQALDVAQSLLGRSQHHNQILDAYIELRQAIAEPDDPFYCGDIDEEYKAVPAQPEPRPQWQQDLIDADKAGKVVEHFSGLTNTWNTLNHSPLDNNYTFGIGDKDRFRIKPDQDHGFDLTDSHLAGEYVCESERVKSKL